MTRIHLASYISPDICKNGCYLQLRQMASVNEGLRRDLNTVYVAMP